MNENKELNLKISANTFTVKNLEIKNGKLELILSAEISSTEIEESASEEKISTSQSEKNIKSSHNSIETIYNSELEIVDEVNAEDPRYGEPQPDIEWQAVNYDDDIVDEVEFDETSAFMSEEQIASSSANESIEKVSSVEPEPVSEVIENDIKGSIKVSENDNSFDDDTLPDYLKSAKISEQTIINNESQSESVFNSLKSSDDTPTVLFERENKTDSDVKIEQEKVEQESSSIKQISDIYTDKPKMVKFLCPRCHSAGSQSIESIGNIITCRNCGRALKLNIKR